MAGEFYVDVSTDELNQGDIVDNLPWGLIVAPTTLCRPVNRSAPTGKAFYGDAALLTSPPPWSHEPEFIHGAGRRGLGIIVWHGCQIDKWKNRRASRNRNHLAKAFVGIAPIISLEKFQPADRQRDVMEGQHHALFPLPAFTLDDRRMPDSYADLRHIWPVKQEIVTDRIVGLSPLGRDALAGHMCMFFTRAIFDPAPKCPKCGTDVLPSRISDELDE